MLARQCLPQPFSIWNNSNSAGLMHCPPSSPNATPLNTIRNYSPGGLRVSNTLLRWFNLLTTQTAMSDQKKILVAHCCIIYTYVRINDGRPSPRYPDINGAPEPALWRWAQYEYILPLYGLSRQMSPRHKPQGYPD